MPPSLELFLRGRSGPQTNPNCPAVKPAGPGNGEWVYAALIDGPAANGQGPEKDEEGLRLWVY